MAAAARIAIAAALLGWSAPGAALAQGEPTMPLDQVRAGMDCQGRSVVRGTAIDTFDVEILDVVAGDAGSRAPRILFRASGPAVDATGLGPGFSGSPISCPDSEGTMRIAGAVSEGIGEYGGKVALATPIMAVLGETADPPATARHDPALLRRARPLALPLAFSGVSGPVADALAEASRRARRPVYAAPAAPRAFFPPQPPRPGSAMSAGLASGDVTAGAVGTVAYVDGDRVWAFGHPLDGVGRRSLFFQDAYVYTVIGNPVGTEDAGTYKLAASGNDLGTLVNDAPEAVVARLGTLPPRFPLKIVARDLDSGRVEVTQTQIADEAALGLPTGVSSLSVVAPIALAQAAYTILRGTPAEQHGRMCVRLTLLEKTSRALRFCNRYVGGGGPESAGAPLVADLVEAASLLDSNRLRLLHPTGMEISVQLGRGLEQAFLLRMAGPRILRRGRTYRFRVTARLVRGRAIRRTIRVRVPRGMPAGPRNLVLTGTPADSAGDGEDLGDVFTLTLGEGEDGSDDSPGPRSLRELVRRFRALERYDGVSAAFRQPGDDGLLDDDERGSGGAEAIAVRDREVYRDKGGLRLSGTARLRVFVVG